jgi:hypothetical protein
MKAADKKLRAAHEAAFEEMKAILTPEQAAKLEQVARQHKGPGPGGPAVVDLVPRTKPAILALHAARGGEPGLGRSVAARLPRRMRPLRGSDPAAAPPNRPNFVVIIADDMAYGLFGPGKRFPFVNLANLETLSSRAAFFERAMVTTSLCSPSRATMLSGLYAHRHGVPGNESTDISPGHPDLSADPSRRGLRDGLRRQVAHERADGRAAAGFDYWLSFRGQGVYFDPSSTRTGSRSSGRATSPTSSRNTR